MATAAKAKMLLRRAGGLIEPMGSRRAWLAFIAGRLAQLGSLVCRAAAWVITKLCLGAQTLTMGQVRVRVIPSIICTFAITIRPSSFTDGASALTITS